MNNFCKLAAVLLLMSAVVQWLGIGEKIYHALWQWYKFKDFGGGGHTTVSGTMAMATYTLSALLVGAGMFLVNCPGGKFVNLVGKISTVSIVTGVLSLSVLLLSPLGELT